MGIFRAIVEGTKNRYTQKKTEIEDRIKNPVGYQRRREAKEIEEHKKRKPYNDVLIEKKKQEVQIAELEARKARAQNKIRTPATSQRQPKIKYPSNQNYQSAPMRPIYDPARVDPGEFMGMTNNNHKTKKKGRGGDPFDLFGGFP